MFDWLKARAMARVPGTAVPYGMAAGAVMGLALGGAYLAGALAQGAAADRAQAERLQSVAMQDAETPDGPTASVNVSQSMASLGGGSRTSASYTQARDLECLTEAVYYEARGETPAGQAAVAQVVLNRVKSPAFPKSVCGVVFQGAADHRAGCQFSFACDGSIRQAREVGAWQRARRVASRAMSGQVTAAVGNATHFHVASIQPDWSGLIKVAQVGTHIFYKFGPRPVAAVAKRAAEVEPAIQAYVEPKAAPMAPPPVILASVTAPVPAKPEASVTVASAVAKPEAVKTEAAKPAL